MPRIRRRKRWKQNVSCFSLQSLSGTVRGSEGCLVRRHPERSRQKHDYAEKLMERKYKEELGRETDMHRLSFEIQLVSVLLLIASLCLLRLSLPLHLPWLFTLLAASIVTGLFLASMVTASVTRLWPRITGFPDCTALRSRLDVAPAPEGHFDEFMDMMDEAASLAQRSLKQQRAILMAAQICQYLAIACLVAAFVTGLCLWL